MLAAIHVPNFQHWKKKAQSLSLSLYLCFYLYFSSWAVDVAHVTESLMLMLLLTAMVMLLLTTMMMLLLTMTTMMILLLTPVTDDFADPIFTVRVEFELGFFVVEAAEARLLRLGMIKMNQMKMIIEVGGD